MFHQRRHLGCCASLYHLHDSFLTYVIKQVDGRETDLLHKLCMVDAILTSTYGGAEAEKSNAR